VLCGLNLCFRPKAVIRLTALDDGKRGILDALVLLLSASATAKAFAFPFLRFNLSTGERGMADETEHTEATSAPDAAAGDAVPGGEPPPLPPTAAALASKAKDLEALRDAVVDAASVGAGLWFSYLFVLFYLLIAVGGVTHADLLLERPVKLPFLQVDLPLLGFFWLGPAIFIIVHVYVLLHFVLLAGKIGDFDKELKAQIADDETRARLRRQLPSNIFVQFLAGPRETRSSILGFLLQAIAVISLVFGPIALLVFFELQFLPYHHEIITWWHRIAVLADIVLLWMLWPPIAKAERTGLSWRDFRRVKIVALAFASLAPVLLVTTIATFPGEWLEHSLPSLQFIPWKAKEERCWKAKGETWRLASLHELLDVDGIAFFRKLVSLRKFLVAGRSILPPASRKAFGRTGLCCRASTQSITPNSIAKQRSRRFP
jgi:hypothetical protein